MPSAAVLVAIGLVLCLAGAVSFRLAVLTAGFGCAWLLAEVFGASTVTGLVVGLAGAAGAFVLTLVLAKVVTFIAGCVVGALVGAKLFVVLGGGDSSWVIALVFVPAVAVSAGFLAGRFQHKFLEWGTAFAGAALVLSGLALASDQQLRLFRRPDDGWESLVLAAAWVGLALLGHAVQRRLVGRRGSTAAH